MQFEPRKRQRLATADLSLFEGDDKVESESYRYWINFYTHPPLGRVTLQETEDAIIERMKLLNAIDIMYKAIDQEGIKRNKMFHEALLSKVCSVRAVNGERNFYVVGRSGELNARVIEARRRDHVSHYLLRLHYCKDVELRKWFIRMETELFRLRFTDSAMAASSYQLTDCLRYYGYHYAMVDGRERSDLHERIHWDEMNRANTSQVVFKLRFEEAPELVRQKRVFLSKGYAYITAPDMIFVLCSQFRAALARELARMYTLLHRLDENRLLSRLDSLHQEYVAGGTGGTRKREVADNPNKIYADQIDKLASTAFPPCMRSIHDKLVADNHLKHYGRLHYGLFLRSAGLPMDEALNFFREKYSRSVGAERFQKEYAYNIRYNYGKEGKRVALSAYGCQKIANDNPPGAGDSHGCPFKHFDAANLRSLLVRQGVNRESDLEEIMAMAGKDRNFQGACTRFFSVKYNGAVPEQGTIYHPNQFFKDAKHVLAGVQVEVKKEETEDATGIGEESTPASCKIGESTEEVIVKSE